MVEKSVVLSELKLVVEKDMMTAVSTETKLVGYLVVKSAASTVAW